MSDYIVKGSDASGVSVQIMKDCTTPINFSDPIEWPYDGLEVYLSDRYGREFAQYKTPTTTGFLPLDIESDPTNGKVLFNIKKADSARFTKGDLYAIPVAIDSTNTDFEDGERKELKRIYLGEVIQQ